MGKLKIPVPAAIISGLIGLVFGIIFVYGNSGAIYPLELLVILVPAVLVGAVLELIFWYFRRRKAPSVAGFEVLPQEIIKFLNNIITNMRYRKSVRYDVMNELASHFEDEFRDCKDEKEKEEKAKELIESFGDPKVLGVLLRRAKKRCRPLWRTAIVRAFQTTGLLFIFLVIYVAWFLSGKPVITTDYVAELNRIVRPVADESQNAAPFYEKAVQLLKDQSDFNDLKTIWAKKPDEVTDANNKQIGKWITENKNILDLVYEGSQKPYFWRTYKTGGAIEGLMGVLVPDLREFRNLARILIWRAQRSAEGGRYEESFKDLITIYSFGRQFRQGNVILVEQLTGIALEALSVGQIREILANYEIDSMSLSILQKNYEQNIAGEDFGIRMTA